MDKPQQKASRFLAKMFFYNLLKFLNLFVPKNKKIWIFGERNGTKFDGNCKYFYLYILKNHKEISPIWLSAKNEIVEQVSTQGGKAYRFNTLRAIYYGLIAKLYIVSHGDMLDVGHYAMRGAKVVNLWHGLPTKKQRNDSQIESVRFSSIERIVRKLTKWLTYHDLKATFDILTSTSELTKEKRKYYFPKTQNIVITGEPRNEIFYEKPDKLAFLSKINASDFRDRKIITYMPTFRDIKSDFKPVFTQFGEFLEKNQAIILVKSHPNEEFSAAKIQFNSNAVINISKIHVDVQELLANTDILITDYSSCFFDFLLSGKPEIFYPYDREEYFQYEEFLYNYDEVTPGPKVYNETDLMLEIEKYLMNPLKDKEQRETIRQKFFEHNDSKACERIYTEILKILC